MIIRYTEQDYKDIQAMNERFNHELLEAKNKAQALQVGKPPEDVYTVGLDPATTSEVEWQEAALKDDAADRAWQDGQPQAYKDALAEFARIRDRQYLDRAFFYNELEKRQFAKLGNDINKIVADAKQMVWQLITATNKMYISRFQHTERRASIDVVALPDGGWKLDHERLISTITLELHLHFEALLGNQDLIDDLTAFIKRTVESDPRVAPKGAPGRGGRVLIPIVTRLHGDENQTEDQDIEDRQIGIDDLIPTQSIEQPAGGRPRLDSMPEQSILLSDFPGRLSIPSMRGYDLALGGYLGGEAYIAAYGDTLPDAQLEFRDGCIVVNGNDDNPIPVVDIKRRPIAQSDVDFGLLLGMYDLIARGADKIEQNGILTVKRAALAERLGFNLRGENAFPLMAKLDQFGKLWGVTKNGSADKLLTVLSYDKDTDMLRIYCGFLLILHRTILESSKRLKKEKGTTKEIPMPSHNFLWHADVANTQSEAALLLAIEITNVILKAGRRNTASIGYKTLVNQVPILKDQISRQKATADKNKVLRRAFTGAFNLIKNKSDAYKYFTGLTIEPAVPPTTTTLSRTIRITHKGLNPEYKDYQL